MREKGVLSEIFYAAQSQVENMFETPLSMQGMATEISHAQFSDVAEPHDIIYVLGNAVVEVTRIGRIWSW
jgi:hypothetical protein